MSPKQHIQSLLNEISKGLYEKDHIIALALLCVLSGESFFLLGPPGTAKSEIARRLKLIFKDAKSFEYLMSRFSTPDEIFGPVSIQKLKSEDTYERRVEGFLPTADIVFLDEIWKAGPAIQNSLLTVLNERIYQNGTTTLHVPMKCLIAASNELPAVGEGLEALWDRFLFRVVCNVVDDDKAFSEMFAMKSLSSASIDLNLKISQDTYIAWQGELKSVSIPSRIVETVLSIRNTLRRLQSDNEMNSDEFFLSDRRWVHIANVLRASAFFNDRKEVNYSDIPILFYILWNSPASIKQIIHLVADGIFSDIIEKISSLETEYDILRPNFQAANNDNTSHFKVFDGSYYRVENIPQGECYISKLEYGNLGYEPVDAVIYRDKYRNSFVIRLLDNAHRPCELQNDGPVRKVEICRNEWGIVVDTKLYYITQTSEELPLFTRKEPRSKELLPIYNMVDSLMSSVSDRMKLILDAQNIFLSSDDARIVSDHYRQIRKRIDILFVKIQRL